MNYPFCPHCGADLARDAPIHINDFSMIGAGHPLCYQDKPLDLTRQETEICWALMKAMPRIVQQEVILNRIGSDGGPDTILVMVSRIRSKFRSWAISCPIVTHRGCGYQWSET